MMMRLFERWTDKSGKPKASDLSAYWHPAQFSPLYDEASRSHLVAMLITSPEKLYDATNGVAPKAKDVHPLAREIDRYARSPWANDEALKACAYLRGHQPKGFVVILEHASAGAYAAQSQQIKAHYAFGPSGIGAPEFRGGLFNEDRICQCLIL